MAATSSTNIPSRDAFLALCEANPNGLTQDAAAAHGWSTDAYLETANGLLREGRMQIFKGPDDKIICRSAYQPEKLKNLSEHEKVVLAKIKEAGDRGLQAKDIAHKATLTTQLVTRSLKNLEVKDLIKAVKSIQTKRGKVWMLYDMTPSKEVAGGTWYKDGEFDTDKINQMRDEILRILRRRAEPQTSEALSTANEREDSDVQQILKVLELDGLVSQANREAGKPTYKIRNDADIFFQCGEMPCFSCPVRRQCTPRPAGPNVPTPRHCEYFTKWLYGGNYDPDSTPVPPDIEDSIMT